MSSNNQNFTLAQNTNFECPMGGDKSDDCADCVYSEEYHFENGECVRRKV